MTGKDLEREGWLTFADRKKINEELSQEEIDELVYEAYKNQSKYKQGKINDKLKERVETLGNRTKKINEIELVAFLTNTNLIKRSFSKELKTYLVLEDGQGICTLLNLTDGIDDSFEFNKSLIITEGLTKINILYNRDESNDFQEPIDISYIQNVKIYTNIELVNSTNNFTVLNNGCILEVIDKKNNMFFVDILNNKIYLRKGIYYLKRNKKTKEFILFERGKKLNIKRFPIKKLI